MKKLDLYVQLSRPFTLLPPLLGIVSGAICAWGSVHNPDPERHLSLSVILTVALGSLCASFMNAASNAINVSSMSSTVAWSGSSPLLFISRIVHWRRRMVAGESPRAR